MVNVQTLHRRAARVLPEVIKTSGVLLEDAGKSELAAMLFPLRRKSTGAMLFRISAETIDAMADRPLAYLKGAMRAREGLGRRQEPFVYREWRVAKVPEGWVSRIFQLQLCWSTQSVDVFFTTKTDGKAWVALVPNRQLAAYLWCD